jgi:hypothetical protein
MLTRSICHVSRGKKDGKFSTKILPMCEASVKVKTSLLSAGTIECCLVYELVDQRNEIEPAMEDHHVYIAVRVFARPFINSYTASAVIFRTGWLSFSGSKYGMKRLHKEILRKHLVNNIYSFTCVIRGQPLKLEAVFHPSKQASIEVTLKKTTEYTRNKPILFK